jgi:hypothetical protein
VKDGKLLLITLNGNGAGSGEGYLSVYTLQEEGTWEITDCRYYNPSCNEEEIKLNDFCIRSPMQFEKFEQETLIQCSDYDAREGDV